MQASTQFSGRRRTIRAHASKSPYVPGPSSLSGSRLAVPRIKPTGWPCPIATPRTSTFSATACHPKPRRRSVFIPLNGQTVLGRANVVRKERAEALASFERARAIRERLAREHPESPNFASNLGGTLNNMATLDLLASSGLLLPAKMAGRAASGRCSPCIRHEQKRWRSSRT